MDRYFPPGCRYNRVGQDGARRSYPGSAQRPRPMPPVLHAAQIKARDKLPLVASLLRRALEGLLQGRGTLVKLTVYEVGGVEPNGLHGCTHGVGADLHALATTLSHTLALPAAVDQYHLDLDERLLGIKIF